jgi:diadenosine tetraphosphate (Ap4A) HIT family hydrolase
MVIHDGFLVSERHTLIIPHRQVGSYFDTTRAERASIETILLKHWALLAAEFNLTDFNIGINDGRMAGQTVPHLHVHLIPRRVDDMQDQRGGVTYVIPRKAKY